MAFFVLFFSFFVLFLSLLVLAHCRDVEVAVSPERYIFLRCSCKVEIKIAERCRLKLARTPSSGVWKLLGRSKVIIARKGLKSMMD